MLLAAAVVVIMPLERPVVLAVVEQVDTDMGMLLLEQMALVVAEAAPAKAGHLVQVVVALL